MPILEKSNSTERRCHTRIRFDTDACVECETGTWLARLLDVSLKGALVARPTDWPDAGGAACILRINLADPGVVIEMHATVVHVEHATVGLRCEHIDVDSIGHLRRLVELNLGDPALLEREFAALVA